MIAFIAYLSIISRWHGGGFIGGSPKVLKNIMWALPFALVTYAVTHNWIWTIFSLTLCTIGKATGHGTAIDLGHGNPPHDPEKLELTFLKGKVSEYTYDFITLSVVGFAAVSGASLAVGIENPLYGLVIALGGMSKPIAYAMGWGVFKSGRIFEPTQVGEFLTGSFAGLALGIVYGNFIL